MGAELIEKCLGIGEFPMGDDFRVGLAQYRHAAEVIRMGLGEHDGVQRAAAHRLQQRLVALCRLAHKAGVDQHVPVAGIHQIGVGNILHHVDEVGDGFGPGLLLPGLDQGGEHRLVVFPGTHGVRPD